MNKEKLLKILENIPNDTEITFSFAEDEKEMQKLDLVFCDASEKNNVNLLLHTASEEKTDEVSDIESMCDFVNLVYDRFYPFTTFMM